MILRLPRRWKIEVSRNDLGSYWDWSDARPRGFKVCLYRVPDWRARYDEKMNQDVVDMNPEILELNPDQSPFLTMLERAQAEMPPRRFTWTGDGESL